MAQESGIFAGLKVIDCASFIAGPGAAVILSDFGAEVVKVEPPGAGDPNRYTYHVPPNPPAEQNYYWQLPNRNKRGIALNLKSAGGTDVLKRLIQTADVFVINFPPHVVKALGLTYDEVSAVNPRIVYADLTGYGDHGPEANKPGYDLTAFWARTGLMDQGRAAGSPPAIPVPGSGDQATATTLYAAIATGLYRRERTGKGCHVSTSLIAAGAWSAGFWLQAALAGATIPGLADREHPTNALVNLYATADNRWILLLLVQEDKEWQALLKALGRPDLLQDPRFADTRQRHANAVALVQILDEVFRTKPLDYWRTALDQERITFGVVQSLQELAHDPQLLANDLLKPIQNGAATPTLTVDSPIIVRQEQKVNPRPAPGLGEHTLEVLAELGYDAAAIEKLSADGVIPQMGAFKATSARLFFMDIFGDRIISTEPDGSDLRVLLEDGRKIMPDGIVIDVETGHIYWTNMGVVGANDGSIDRMNLDGSHLTTLVPSGATHTPKQLVMDKKNRKLYWCDREGMRVMRSNLDGSKLETLVESGHGDTDRQDARNWCVGIAIDVERSKIYWTQKGNDNAGQGRIFRTNFEIPTDETPANRSDIEVLFEDLPEPIDLELDLANRTIYWTDRGDPPRGNTVNRAGMDTAPKQRTTPEILLGGLNEGIGIALDLKGGRMFVTDLKGSLYSAKLDGSDKKTLAAGMGGLTGVAYAEVPVS